MKSNNLFRGINWRKGVVFIIQYISEFDTFIPIDFKLSIINDFLSDQYGQLFNHQP